MRRGLLALLIFLVSGNLLAVGDRGGWVAGGGFGLTFSPTLVLLNPQLEYVVRPNLYVGPNLQLGLGDPGTLFTATGTARLAVGNHRHLKPSFEGGLGVAVLGSQVGVCIQMGLGVDYQIDRSLSVGTMLRGNFAPPADTFFFSWPIIVGRFAL